MRRSFVGEGERGEFEIDDAVLPIALLHQRSDQLLSLRFRNSSVQKTEDASGKTRGQGSVLKQTLKDAEEHWRRPTPRSDVAYRLSEDMCQQDGAGRATTTPYR